jgi:hypothetical protein
MPTTFDPYHLWLGIPPEERPPHHYRLLGLKAMETDLDVIEHAADQKMLHLRTFQSGKHYDESQKLLNEIAAAKAMLLMPEKKAAYDAQLRAKLEGAKSAETRKFPVAPPLSAEKPGQTKVGLARNAVVVNDAASIPRRQTNSKPLLFAIAGGGLILFAGIAVYVLTRSRQEVVAVAPATAPTSPMSSTSSTEREAESKIVPVVKSAIVPPPISAPAPTPATTSAEAPRPVEPPLTPPEISEAPIEIEPPLASELPVTALNPPPAEEESQSHPAAEVPAVDPAKKEAVPGKAQRDAKRAEILELFPPQKARTAADKKKFVEQLITTAGETVDDPPARFALLNLARELAAEAGDVRLTLDAIDRLEEYFEVDADGVRVTALLQVLKGTAPPSTKRDAIDAGIELATELAAKEKFDEIDDLCDRLLAAARSLRDAEQVQFIGDLRRNVGELAANFKKASAAMETLKTMPDNADAALIAGRYLAFIKEDWKAGIRNLAKGSDAPLAAAAKAEMAEPEEAADQIKLADYWWAAAESQKLAWAKERSRERAVFWYRKNVAGLTGLAKARVEKRIAEAGAPSSLTTNTLPKPKRQIIRISVSGTIEGSDAVRIYLDRAEWKHHGSEWATNVTLNGQAWPVRTQAVLPFDEALVQKTGQLDFQKSEMLKVRGRGEFTLIQNADYVEVFLADPQSGSDQYEVVLSIYATGKPLAASPRKAAK